MTHPATAPFSTFTSTRAAVLAVLALLVLLWSAVAWNNQDTERRELDEVRRETATLALLFAHEADSTFRNVDQALLDLRSTWVNRAADLGDMALKYKESLAGAILQIAIIGADGNLAYSNLGMPKETTFLGEREHFKVHTGGLQDKLFVSRPLKGKVSGKWSIQLSRPIFRHEEFVGVAVISVDPNYFVRFYQNAGMGIDGAARMIRDTGEIMARSSDQDKYVGQVIDSSLYTSPGAPQQGSFRRKSQVDGVERLSSYYRLPQYGLAVLVGPSVSERLAPLHNEQRQILLVVGLVTVLLLLAAWLLLRAMVRNAAAHRALVSAEVAARESGQRLAEVIWGTRVATWEWHIPSGACVFNERWAEMAGYTLAELAPVSIATWQRLVHPDDGQRAGELLTRCFSRELDAYDCELRMHHKDGHWVWVHDRGRVVEWAADGQPLRMAGTHHDITERKQTALALNESQQRFRSFVENAKDIVYAVTSTGVFIYVSPQWQEMFGYEITQTIGQNFANFVHPDDVPACQAFLQRAFSRDVVQGEVEYRVFGKDGSVHWHASKGSVIQDAATGARVFQGFGRDITERKWAEEASSKAALYTRSLIEASLDPLVTISPEGKISDVNRATEVATGRTRGDLIGSDFSDYFTEPELARAGYLQVLAQGQVTDYALAIRHASGSITDVLYNASVYRNPDGTVEGVFAAARDITARKAAQEQLLHMAQHDALTGLANRALFADRLQRAIANALRDKATLALLFIDLDRFKPVNDQFGHSVGDLLLKQVAQRLLVCVRDSDTVARMGGDEFVVLLRDVAGVHEALAVADKIRASLDTPFALAEYSVHIASCVGVALYPQHGADDQTLSKNADHAMYQAKERGRNQVVLFEAAP